MAPRSRFNLGLVAALHDTVMAASSFALALFLRFGTEAWPVAQEYVVLGTIIFTVICLAVFTKMKLYRGLWRYASLEDLVAIARAVTLSILIFASVMFFISRLEYMPRSVLVINWFLLLVMLGGPRFLYRMAKDKVWMPYIHSDRQLVPLLLIGANPSADMFIRELRRDPGAPYHIVGIVDDDPTQHGRTMCGVRIYGNTSIIPHIVEKLGTYGKRPQRLIVTQELPAPKLQALLADADAMGVTLGRLPRLSDFKEGVEERLKLRTIAIEDLLGRSQSTQGKDAMRDFITGKRILVTGAGGSIGGELCRQIATYAPESLTMFDISEYALYRIDHELAETAPGVILNSVIGDVRNHALINNIFATYKPHIVFHAAAMKHVPLSEKNPLEAISTNVLGTQVVAEACQRHRTAAMVQISTDKAVNPYNVMGATKRLAERVCQAEASGLMIADHFTQYITVRFGNVLGSTGSVVPLFHRQLERGGPITVTHPDMLRYFMTIREAVELVIHAAMLAGEHPERRSALYVLDMGTPMRIVDLARQMIRLSGLRPDHDIHIEFTGLRPGEKLYEELFYSHEQVMSTSCEGILSAQTLPDPGTNLPQSLETLHRYCQEQKANEALALLRQLVPEYHVPEISPAEEYAPAAHVQPLFPK
jgi:FlaA1/EpsC-like NDP-sugar epimerase